MYTRSRAPFARQHVVSCEVPEACWAPGGERERERESDVPSHQPGTENKMGPVMWCGVLCALFTRKALGFDRLGVGLAQEVEQVEGCNQTVAGSIPGSSQSVGVSPRETPRPDCS